ncbi:MAG: hypothetical protein NTV86_23975 [Planctomycetota bacterium]|nr:hypothetical protein [Planctomycetota bacterium]
MIEFTCEGCGQKLKVPETFAGKKAKCPHCKGTIDIPMVTSPVAGPGDLDVMAAAGPAAPTPPPLARGPAGPGAHGEPATPGGLPFPAGAIDAALNSLRRSISAFFVQAESVAFQIGVYGLLALVPFFLVMALVLGTAKSPSASRQLTDSSALAQVSPFSGRSRFAPRPSMDLSDDSMATAAMMDAMGPSPVTLLVLALVLLVCQYVVSKIRSAAIRVVASSPSRTSSSNILDCVALLLLVGGVALLITGTVAAYHTRAFLPGLLAVGSGVIGAFVCFVMASLALNPQVLNVSIVPGEGAGAEALGLMSFILKLILRTGPFLLAAAVLTALVGFIAAGSQAPTGATSAALAGAAVVSGHILAAATFVYFLCYLAFLFYHLTVDVIQAIFQTAANTRKHP